MSNKKRKHGYQAQSSPPTSPVSQPVTPAPEPTPADLVTDALALGEEAALAVSAEQALAFRTDSAASIPSAAAVVSPDDLRLAVNEATVARRAFEGARKNADALGLAAATEKTSYLALQELLRAEIHSAEAAKQDATNETKKAEQAKSCFENEMRKVQQDKADLAEREANASAGFLKEREQALQSLHEELERLRTEASRLTQVRADAETTALQTVLARLAEFEVGAHRTVEAELVKAKARIGEIREGATNERLQLETDRQKQIGELSALMKARRQLDADRADLDEERTFLKERAEQLAAQTIEALNAQLRAVEESRDQARRDRDKHRTELRTHEEAAGRAGHRSIAELQQENESLRTEAIRLEAEMARRLDDDGRKKLQTLERERQAWLTDRSQIELENERLRLDLERARVGVSRVETLTKTREAYEDHIKLLQAKIDDLRKEIDGLTARGKARLTFPECSAMDANPEYQRREPTTDGVRDLKTFVEDLQQRIAHDPESDNRLYYDLRDLRLFVGGVATTRLHILQGVSGIGKTSLPRAFANSIGAGKEIVAVQSGWRDRADLLGSYNTFEERFQEERFLQALYRAGQPRFVTRPFMVVLDEMNLSRPEHYLADFLSALELPEQSADRDIPLMNFTPPNPPRQLRDGRILPWPANAWFFGTANHDETTNEFADKTYERAHVTELPQERPRFPLKPPDLSRPPLSLSRLLELFKESKGRHAKEAARSYEYLQSEFGALLYNDFGIGITPRLQKQLETFVPVVIECGGSIGEATDHVLATKLLRKIKDRHEARERHYRALAEVLDKRWIDPKHPSQAARKLVERELARHRSEDSGP